MEADSVVGSTSSGASTRVHLRYSLQFNANYKVYVAAGTAALTVLMLTVLSLNLSRVQWLSDATDGNGYRHDVGVASSLYVQTRDHALIFVVLVAGLESVYWHQENRIWLLSAVFLIARAGFAIAVFRDSSRGKLIAEATTHVVRLGAVVAILAKLWA